MALGKKLKRFRDVRDYGSRLYEMWCDVCWADAQEQVYTIWHPLSIGKTSGLSMTRVCKRHLKQVIAEALRKNIDILHDKDTDSLEIKGEISMLKKYS